MDIPTPTLPSNITNLMDVATSIMNSSATPTPTTTTPSPSPSPSVSPPPSNLVNYGDIYYSPLEMKTWSKYLISDYANALITGNTPVYKNPATVLPGNRYFLDTNTQCKDASGSVHDRSVIIDNVLQTRVDESNTAGNHGLMYSFLASLESLDKSSYPPIPTYSPTAYLSDVSGQSNIPACVPVSIYLDGTNSTTASGWITETDRAELDPLALKEGFSVNSIQSVKPRDTINSMQNTVSSYARHAQTVGSQSSGQLSQVQSSQSQKLNQGGVQAQAVGLQDSTTLSTETSGAKASSTKTIGSQMAQLKTQEQQQYRQMYDASYQSMPIIQLFQKFVTYASPTQSTIVPAQMMGMFDIQPATENYVRLSGDCFDYVLNKLPSPKNLQNLFPSSQQCLTSNYPEIQVGDFIANLQQQAAEYKGKSNVTLTLPTQYIPQKSVCETVRSKSALSVVSVFTGQSESVYNYTQQSVAFDKNYNAFMNAIEPYRYYIITAFLSLDYPKYFDTCPPVKPKFTTPPAYLQDTFTVMSDRADYSSQKLKLYLVLCLIILLLCTVAYFAH
jgi:hypothetical protein